MTHVASVTDGLTCQLQAGCLYCSVSMRRVCTLVTYEQTVWLI